jgi:hypothetical protein
MKWNKARISSVNPASQVSWPRAKTGFFTELILLSQLQKLKTDADEEDYEIQTSRKTGVSGRSLQAETEGMPDAVCRGFCGEV